LLIEAAIPLRVHLRSGEIHLRPGQPVELSDDDGRKLLERAKGKVWRVNELRPGSIITWDAPDLTGMPRRR